MTDTTSSPPREGLSIGDTFFRCSRCEYRSPSNVAMAPQCPECGKRMNSCKVVEQDIPRTRDTKFAIVMVSSNANSFGLHGHILVDKTGRAFEAARARGPWLTDLASGDTINLRETISPGGENFDWARNSFEIPRRLKPDMPASLLKEVWGKVAAKKAAK